MDSIATKVAVAAVASVAGVKLLEYGLWAVREILRAVRIHTTLPGPPQALVLGNVQQVIANPVHQQVEKWAQQYGDVFRVRFLHRTIVVVTHPETVAAILRTGPTYLPKYRASYEIFEKIVVRSAPSILTAHDTDPYWRAVRKVVAQAFTAANLKLMFPEVVSLSRVLAGQLLSASAPPSPGDQAQAVDVDNAAQRLTVDVIGKLAFGRDFAACDFRPNARLEIVGGLLQGLQLQLNPINRIFPWRKDARVFRQWRVRFSEVVQQMVEDALRNPQPSHTIMAHLLSMTDPNTGRPLTRAQLEVEAATLLVAGFETTAHSIAWTLFLLATHPEAEAAVVAELARAGLCATPDNPSLRPVAWSDLGQLPQLDAAINESLRLFPAASGGSARHVTSQGLQVGKFQVPAGSMLWIPTWTIHRDPGTWGADAAQFRPSRWLSKDSSDCSEAVGAGAQPGGGASHSGDSPKSASSKDGSSTGQQGDFFVLRQEQEGTSAAGARARGGYMPFSHGPRDCVGQSLAVLELRVALATLLGHARFSLAPEMGGYQKVATAARQHITLKPMVPGPDGQPARMGLLMHVTPRAAPAP